MPDQRKAGCNSGILEAWSSAPTSVSTASLAGRVFPFPLDGFLLTLQGFPQTDSHQNCYLYTATIKSDQEPGASGGHSVIRINSQWAFDFQP